VDIGLDAVEPGGIGLAILCALGVEARTLCGELAIEPLEESFIGEGAARDGRDQRKEPADQGRDGSGQTMIAEGGCGGGQKTVLCGIAHAGAPIDSV
jgi:hypothetical protein